MSLSFFALRDALAMRKTFLPGDSIENVSRMIKACSLIQSSRVSEKEKGIARDCKRSLEIVMQGMCIKLLQEEDALSRRRANIEQMEIILRYKTKHERISLFPCVSQSFFDFHRSYAREEEQMTRDYAEYFKLSRLFEKDGTYRAFFEQSYNNRIKDMLKHADWKERLKSLSEEERRLVVAINIPDHISYEEIMEDILPLFPQLKTLTCACIKRVKEHYEVLELKLDDSNWRDILKLSPVLREMVVKILVPRGVQDFSLLKDEDVNFILKNFTNVTELDLRECSSISDEAFKGSDLSKMHVLQLGGTAIGDDTLIMIFHACCNCLDILDISYCRVTKRAFDDMSFYNISILKVDEIATIDNDVIEKIFYTCPTLQSFSALRCLAVTELAFVCAEGAAGKIKCRTDLPSCLEELHVSSGPFSSEAIDKLAEEFNKF
jgi:hypothetical protein